MKVVFPDPRQPISRYIFPLSLVFMNIIMQLYEQQQTKFRLQLQLKLQLNYNKMSLSQKDFYFLTDRSTLFRYFVDNSSGKSKRYIFYPRKYEQMTDKQIIKYERKLNINFLWWAIRNKSKMAPYDYSICRSHVVDGMFIVLSTLVLARLARITLFRHQFNSIQRFLQNNNLDVKFWKAITAYAFTFTAGFSQLSQLVNQISLTDLAIQYSPNFTQDLQMPQIQQTLNKCYKSRFAWLGEQQKLQQN